eukprot:760578-Hanusia_phi.AAC.5
MAACNPVDFKYSSSPVLALATCFTLYRTSGHQSTRVVDHDLQPVSVSSLARVKSLTKGVEHDGIESS